MAHKNKIVQKFSNRHFIRHKIHEFGYEGHLNLNAMSIEIDKLIV